MRSIPKTDAISLYLDPYCKCFLPLRRQVMALKVLKQLLHEEVMQHKNMFSTGKKTNHFLKGITKYFLGSVPLSPMNWGHELQIFHMIMIVDLILADGEADKPKY